MRRYAPIKPSRGTTWPTAESNAIFARDRGLCVGPVAGMADTCEGSVERDHVRASHGIGLKSPSTRTNGVLLCGRHHRYKTEHGREVRPLLIAYLERHYPEPVR